MMHSAANAAYADYYQRLIDTLLESRAGIARYFTYVVTKPVKTPGAPPFAELLDDPGIQSWLQQQAGEVDRDCAQRFVNRLSGADGDGGGDALPQSPRHGQRLVDPGDLLGHDDKLVAADTCNQVIVTYALLQPGRDFAQHPITRVMAATIVGRLEPIEIQVQQRQAATAPCRVIQRVLQFTLQAIQFVAMMHGDARCQWYTLVFQGFVGGDDDAVGQQRHRLPKACQPFRQLGAIALVITT